MLHPRRRACRDTWPRPASPAPARAPGACARSQCPRPCRLGTPSPSVASGTSERSPSHPFSGRLMCRRAIADGDVEAAPDGERRVNQLLRLAKCADGGGGATGSASTPVEAHPSSAQSWRARQRGRRPTSRCEAAALAPPSKATAVATSSSEWAVAIASLRIVSVRSPRPSASPAQEPT